MNHLISKLHSIFGAVIKVKLLLNKKSLLLNHFFINSQLSYCNLNWCYGNTPLLKKLKQLCHKFGKVIFTFSNNSTVSDIMKENKLLTVDQLLTKKINCAYV